MNDKFKVCGNCGHCTMLDGQFVCIDPQKQRQEVVPMGARRACFVVTALSPKQFLNAAIAPLMSNSIN